jgi:membrane-associated phospholipid phosphatase
MCQFNEDTMLCYDETTSARESFPSGHAATALASMTLVSLFLLGKVRGGTRQRGISEAATDAKPVDDVDDIMWTPTLIEKPLALLAISPIFLGMFIASSRVRDNWHHPADVICGGIIGMGCSMFAHGLWYPSSYSHYAGIPLSTVKAILVERKARAMATAASRYTVDLEA